MRRPRPMSAVIARYMLAILVVTMLLGLALYSQVTRRILDQHAEQKSLVLAESVAANSSVRAAMAAGDGDHAVRGIAESIRAATGASYVVVIDRAGRRHSHPTEALIGEPIDEPVVALDGRNHVQVDHGILGPSANAKAPLRGPDGALIGEVSVGFTERDVSRALWAELPVLVLYTGAALLVGILASLVLARRLKRRTFGLELHDLASLLQEREAMLYGIREGVIAFDSAGRLTMANEEARRLLVLRRTAIGDPVEELVPPGRLRDLLSGDLGGQDQIVLTDTHLLVVNRMPVRVAGRDVGAVVTLRDRTEVEALVRDLRSLRGLIEALRAQEHEYANRLHVVDGLLEMGDVEQARRFVSRISDTSRSLGEGLRARVEPPELAALLLAKITVAAEQDVTITVTEDSRLDQTTASHQSLLTIVGNLLDNAVDALANTPEPRVVTIQFDDADGVFIAVRDNGPGVPAHSIEQVLVDGYSTKEARPGMRRGIGLALVSRIVRRAAGTLDVFPGPGGHFEVWLPADSQATSPNDEDTP